MTNLNGKVAIVTGATRGVGRGMALELAEAGATVYATGRTIAEETFAKDKHVIPVRCDHTRDSEVEATFHRIIKRQDRLDILVNCVWGGYENMVENEELHGCSPFGSNRFGGGMQCLRQASAHITLPVLTRLARWSSNTAA